MYQKRYRISFEVNLEITPTSEDAIQDHLEGFKQQLAFDPSLQGISLESVREITDRQMRLLRALVNTPALFEQFIQGELHTYIRDDSGFELAQALLKPAPRDIPGFLQPVIATLEPEDQAYFEELGSDLDGENLSDFYEAFRIDLEKIEITELTNTTKI
jgi:hypothetical protein